MTKTAANGSIREHFAELSESSGNGADGASRIMESSLRECFNCLHAEYHNEEEQYIEFPQAGHYLNDAEQEQFAKFLDNQR